MGAAVQRIHGLGAKQAGRESRAGLVDPSRLVHQPRVPARRHASVQQADRVRDTGPHRRGGARGAGIAAAGAAHELAVRAIRTALAAEEYVPAAGQRHPDFYMSLKGSGGGRGLARCEMLGEKAERWPEQLRRPPAAAVSADSRPDITWDAAYTGSSRRDSPRRVHEAHGVGRPRLRLRPPEVFGGGRPAHHAHRARGGRHGAVARGRAQERGQCCRSD